MASLNPISYTISYDNIRSFRAVDAAGLGGCGDNYHFLVSNWLDDRTSDVQAAIRHGSDVGTQTRLDEGFCASRSAYFRQPDIGELAAGNILFGVMALVGNTEPLRGVAAEVSTMPVPVLVWQLKLGLVALFLTNAFLKFVWANRVFGYCAVIMASVPNDPTDPKAYPRAAQAAELNIRGAMNFNRGLRAMYFALGALAWLIGPYALIIATATVFWVLWSREFASIPRSILLKEEI